ncbi:molecular chaperone HscC, partial [Escherichia coli]|nr:molecular chaperone HscC [Escherichia coli]
SWQHHLTAEQIQQSLSKLSLLKIHPRDEQINQAFIARLDNLYQLTLAETRDWISNCSRHFSYLLEKQDPDQLADFRTKVEPTLDSLERERLQ